MNLERIEHMPASVSQLVSNGTPWAAIAYKQKLISDDRHDEIVTELQKGIQSGDMDFKKAIIDWGIEFIQPTSKTSIRDDNKSVTFHQIDGKDVASYDVEEIIDLLIERNLQQLVRQIFLDMEAAFQQKKPSQASNG